MRHFSFPIAAFQQFAFKFLPGFRQFGLKKLLLHLPQRFLFGPTVHFLGAAEMYGWTKEEALGKMKQELLQPKLPKSWKELEGELLKRGYWEGEVTHVRRDGSRLIVQTRWALRREAKSAVVLEINSDITAKKRSEENLRQLSTYLIRLQDEERRRIARELHDSTGQKLILLKMNLEALAAQLDADPRKVPKLPESIRLVDEATQEIRTLSQLLHPPLLDEAGLAVAAKWL